MPRQLSIRSDDAYALATKLAAERGQTVTATVEEALRLLERSSPPKVVNDPAWEALDMIVEDIRKHLPPDASSAHDWLYDEHGLPR